MDNYPCKVAAAGEGASGRLIFGHAGASTGIQPWGISRRYGCGTGIGRRHSAAQLGGWMRRGRLLVLDSEKPLKVFRSLCLRRVGDEVLVRGPIEAAMSSLGPLALLGARIAVKPLRSGLGTRRSVDAPQMIALTKERRAKLVAFGRGEMRMPAGC